MCQDEKAQDQMLKELNDIGKKNGFKGLELLQCVMCVCRASAVLTSRSLSHEEWTPQNGLLSASLGRCGRAEPVSPSPEASAQGDPVQIRG